MTFYIVWNESRTEGFITNEHQLAYEVRKGSVGNCYREDGTYSKVGVEFAETFMDENCTIEKVEL